MKDTSVIRTFIGIPLPEAYQAQSLSIQDEWANTLSSRISWTRQGNLHCTLKFIGATAVDSIDELIDRLLQCKWESFTLQAGGAGTFPFTPKPHPKTIWAGLIQGHNETASLANAVAQAVLPEQNKKWGRFYPHITLGSVKKPENDNWQIVLDSISSVQWDPIEVTEYTLWRSDLSHEGPTYTPLHSFKAS